MMRAPADPFTNLVRTDDSPIIGVGISMFRGKGEEMGKEIEMRDERVEAILSKAETEKHFLFLTERDTTKPNSY